MNRSKANTHNLIINPAFLFNGDRTISVRSQWVDVLQGVIDIAKINHIPSLVSVVVSQIRKSVSSIWCLTNMNSSVRKLWKQVVFAPTNIW
ncbi:hypothetical protein Trydic_g13070 [Trypoxylus dichotomus]